MMKSLLKLAIASSFLFSSVAFAEEAELANCSATLKKGEYGYVARSAFTNKIVNREPEEKLEHVKPSSKKTKIYFFTEIKAGKGTTVYHRWMLNGEFYTDVKFTVKGNRWRVYSSKNMYPEQGDNWEVLVVDTRNCLIDQASIVVEAEMKKEEKSMPTETTKTPETKKKEAPTPAPAE